MRLRTVRYLLLVPSLWVPLAVAYNFVPAEAEFLAWPAYCKVAYVRTTIGSQSKFPSLVSSADIAAASSVLGSSTFGDAGFHHYCAGSAWLSRARTATDDRTRAHDLGRAEAETSYTLERIEHTHHLYPMVATQMAYIRYERGDITQGAKLLDAVIDAHPTNPMPYSAKAIIHFKEGEFELARKVLVAGNEKTHGQSPEIHYNLGLVLLKVNQPQLASVHARKAYELGYPLPGLKHKLQRLGHWDEAN